MIDQEIVLQKALEAVWAKIAKACPERGSGALPPGEAYDLEKYGRNALDAWLELNKPVYYVQRTTVQVLRITGAVDPEEAEAFAADIGDPDWFERSLDTNYEYLVLDLNGKPYK